MSVESSSSSARERALAAGVAARAFGDDPFFRFLLPRDERRVTALTRLHRGIFEHLGARSRFSLARESSGSVIGVAAWLTTGGFPQSVGLQLASAPSSLRAMGLGRSLRDGSAYVRAAAREHPHAAHWYLWVLAVEPSQQRRGVGRALLEASLGDVDAEGVGVHLETQNPDNIPYYERFGFTLSSTLRPIEGAPALYGMWRAGASEGDA